MSAFAKQAFTLIPRGFFLPKLNKPSRVADDLGGRGGGSQKRNSLSCESIKLVYVLVYVVVKLSNHANRA